MNIYQDGLNFALTFFKLFYMFKPFRIPFQDSKMVRSEIESNVEKGTPKINNIL